MENQSTIRNYTISDKEAVLNLLKLNTPAHFSAEEEKDLNYYLDHEIEQYFVLELNQHIVGCGGINFSEDNSTGIISWDIIHPEFQGQSLGSKLLKYRIGKLQQLETVHQIIVRTSQLSYKFYEKLGFRLLEVMNDYWAKGFHLYKMKYVDSTELSCTSE
ncbi:GNAT family N-acetyltransferase [Paradesertivirga mongoliensis]|uniref:GNAT family N-acetyltransferase n=1 Tax=Paradesertivirga mongoliensis TaxID=2100740 RepID=A0ABW4ZM24_9SPHI|nr:GNAT family N-acetyltransferase [Pedobacter mongoliensis]